MIPIFHATGHIFYAKCAHMYLQDCVNLKEKLGEADYNKFVSEGYFTIRRSESFWSGLRSDMTIEQWLMRASTCDGLTKVRGLQKSNLAKVILSMPLLINVIDCFREFCHVTCDTSEQHIDNMRNRDPRSSMIKRDNKDIGKIYNWIKDHLPFPKSEI